MEKDPIKDCLEELANSLETNEIFKKRAKTILKYLEYKE